MQTAKALTNSGIFDFHISLETRRFRFSSVRPGPTIRENYPAIPDEIPFFFPFFRRYFENKRNFKRRSKRSTTVSGGTDRTRLPPGGIAHGAHSESEKGTANDNAS